ncbi:hypothetical protein V5799_018082 [Amblyomma americanum]|uniref:RING-type domain-containing protein n=1 Tax=Amblyomma americanum TaxID=6943 RepID=A0AAQ4F0T1_AMBAM
MAPASPQFTLVGFSPELDWRPLTFLKPIPANRVCSACGLVRKKTAILPCMHVLCWCCYEQCAQDGAHECPLDGSGYEEDDVNMFDFPTDDLLRREVKCWNEDSNRVCSACGLVRKRTALLPCMHVLCECCYEQCDQDDFNECPLDGNHYEMHDVTIMVFSDYLLRSE